MEGIEFVRPALARQNLESVRAHLGGEGKRLLEPILDGLKRSADPDASLNHLENLLGRGGASAVDWLVTNPGMVSELVAFLGGTDYFAGVVVREGTAAFLGEPLPEDFEAAAAAFARDIAALAAEPLSPGAEREGALLGLRRYRDRALARICYRDLAGADLYTVGLWLSALADALVGAVLRIICPDTPLAVIALGKLGGKELNYSSDIDILFISDGAGAEHAAQVVLALSAMTGAGYLYRVDTRLRPDGSQGALAPSLEAALNYYQNIAAAWERQALLKARFCAGDRALGEEFIASIQPLIYQRPLGLADIAELREMRAAAESRSKRTDLKTGPGGIRDIEFIVQFLQLFHGSEYPQVRERNTLRALDLLERTGCIAQREAEILTQGYRFLRTVEHRVMTFEQTKAHALPTSPSRLRKLSRLLGYPDAGALQAELANRTTQVRALFEQVFGNLGGGSTALDFLLSPAVKKEDAQRELARAGFKDPERARRNLESLAEDRPAGPDPRVRRLLVGIAPELLDSLRAAWNPDHALENLGRILAAAGRKAAFYESFRTKPQALQALVTLASESDYLADLLVGNPDLLQDAIGTLDRPLTRSVSEHVAAIRDLGSPAPDAQGSASATARLLNAYKNSQILRIGLNDLLGRCSTLRSTQELSDLAEGILLTVLIRQGVGSEFAVLALGKFGARSLNYSSDLDLIFLCPDLAGQARATALASKVIEFVSQPSQFGKLYSLDLRLRPEGAKGVLVPTVESFRSYHASGRAQVWERQALCKARIVYAPPALRLAIETLIADVLYSKPPDPSFVEELRLMRERQVKASSTANVKLAAGGLQEIDFIAEAYSLAFGWKYPALRHPSTTEVLRQAKELGLLPDSHADLLLCAYLFYRVLENKLQILSNLHVEELPQGDGLRRLALRLGYADQATRRESSSAAELLLQELRYYQRRTHELFLASLDAIEDALGGEQLS